MLNEANNRNLSPEGYEGGLLIDEMTIQQDIQFSKRKKGFHRGIKTHEHTNEPQEKCMSGHTCVAYLKM
jgi:hypothetical protein